VCAHTRYPQVASRLSSFGPYWLGTFVMVYGTVKVGMWYDDHLARQHRC
jgi:hypothetical protein